MIEVILENCHEMVSFVIALNVYCCRGCEV